MLIYFLFVSVFFLFCFHCLSAAVVVVVDADDCLLLLILSIGIKTGSEVANRQSRLQVEVRRRSVASGTPFQVRMP